MSQTNHLPPKLLLSQSLLSSIPLLFGATRALEGFDGFTLDGFDGRTLDGLDGSTLLFGP